MSLCLIKVFLTMLLQFISLALCHLCTVLFTLYTVKQSTLLQAAHSESSVREIKMIKMFFSF